MKLYYGDDSVCRDELGQLAERRQWTISGQFSRPEEAVANPKVGPYLRKLLKAMLPSLPNLFSGSKPAS